MPPRAATTSLDDLVRSPFARLTLLLEGLAPGASPIDLSLGEPKALVPPFLGPTLQEHLSEFGRYPPIKGTPALRQAIADWMGRHYPILKVIDILMGLRVSQAVEGEGLDINLHGEVVQ